MALLGCFSAALFALVFAFVSHHLSYRGFAFAVFAMMAIMFVVLLTFFAKVRERSRLVPEAPGGTIDNATRKRLRKSIRICQIIMVLLAFSLIYALIAARNEKPLWPTLVGVAINLLWQYVLIVAIRKAQRRLQQA
jgi:Na+/melibiose symporter-like transporter